MEQRHDIPPTRDALDAPFVGRAESSKHLRTRLDEARDGRGDILLVAGPPGIGKTRVADELARVAAAGGADVRRGRWYEEGDARPLAPWREIMKAEGDLLAAASSVPTLIPFVHSKRFDLGCRVALAAVRLCSWCSRT